MAKIELQITNNQGVTSIVDVLDSPFRLNRTVFTTSEDNLKSLGGVSSTNIRLAKSKRNNLLFNGRSEFDDYNKFNNGEIYKAVLIENGYELARGTFSFDEGSISWDAYEGTFYDENIDWVQSLSNINLNELDYVDGKPTWLVPFDGAITFDQINDLDNTQTDFVCPTIVYNNTPFTDYMDLTDEEIWGTFDLSDPNVPVRLTPAFDTNDFVCENAVFNCRLGKTFDGFPPAVNYKNLIQRIFDNIGVEIDCPLFSEEWFNAIYMPYVGDAYKYNWKNIASVFARTLEVEQLNDFDVLYQSRTGLIFSTAPVYDVKFNISAWYPNTSLAEEPVITYKEGNILKHDDTVTLIDPQIDKIVAYNKFGQLDQHYVAPTDGKYTITVASQYESEYTDFNPLPFNTSTSTVVNVDGDECLKTLGSWDANSPVTSAAIDRQYAWDDNVLVVLRKNQNNDSSFNRTLESLFQWMNGENKDFINNPSDAIAYYSPKRKYYNDNISTLNEEEWKGSPFSNFTEQVIDGEAGGSVYIDHNVTSENTTFASNSNCSYSVEVDLTTNDRVYIFWVSLGDVRYNTGTTSSPTVQSCADTLTQNFGLNTTDPVIEKERGSFSISYNCGEYDLDLAQNLPNMTCKDFISSFIRQFNLFKTFEDNTVKLLPQRLYYSDNSYDITRRVVSKSWNATPLPTPKTWRIGYNIDPKDRLLSDNVNACVSSSSRTNGYGNLEFDNPNAFSEKTLTSFNMFSSTKFVKGSVSFHILSNDVFFFKTSPDPVTGLQIFYGPEYFSRAGSTPLDEFIPEPLSFPAIQSLESYNQLRLGDLTYDYNYAPRLIYHLGTLLNYVPALQPDPNSDKGAVLVDSPRPVSQFFNKDKHWFIPTVSQFDKENELLTGISYPSLRYDRSVYDEGLYERYFENIIELYNESEMFTVNMALTPSDWEAMEGSRKIRYRDQLYRLSEIKDYDPQTNNICTIKMIKEI